MAFLLRRLTGLLTAIAVAVCPTLFAVCAEQCAHSAQSQNPLTSSSHHRHAAVSETDRSAMTATPGHLHQSETTDAAGEPGACHHDVSSTAASAGEHSASFDKASVPAAATQIAASCSQCFGDAPVLMAARGSDDGPRITNAAVTAGTLLSPRTLAAINSETHAGFASNYHTPPPASPSASTVLRI